MLGWVAVLDNDDDFEHPEQNIRIFYRVFFVTIIDIISETKSGDTQLAMDCDVVVAHT